MPITDESPKSVIRKQQMLVAESLYPEDLSPQEVGQLSLKLLMADFLGELIPTLEPSERAFLQNLTKKYTADAPKAIEIEHKTSPEEMLYKALENEEALVHEAVERSEQFGEEADKKTKLVEEFEAQ